MQSDDLRVSSLRITNKFGVDVITLGTDSKGNPEIVVLDKDKHVPRVKLEIEGDRASLGFLSSDGALLVGIGCEFKRGGGVTIADSSGTTIATLAIDSKTGQLISIFQPSKV